MKISLRLTAIKHQMVTFMFNIVHGPLQKKEEKKEVWLKWCNYWKLDVDEIKFSQIIHVQTSCTGC